MKEEPMRATRYGPPNWVMKLLHDAALWLLVVLMIIAVQTVLWLAVLAAWSVFK